MVNRNLQVDPLGKNNDDAINTFKYSDGLRYYLVCQRRQIFGQCIVHVAIFYRVDCFFVTYRFTVSIINKRKQKNVAIAILLFGHCLSYQPDRQSDNPYISVQYRNHDTTNMKSR